LPVSSFQSCGPNLKEALLSHTYRDLIVWQKAKSLAIQVYRLTASFPSSEKYGLTSQLRRAAVSVVSNVAEGQGRLTSGEFAQFLGHARGSLHELETQIEIAAELGLLPEEAAKALADRAGEVGRLLNGLVASLEGRSKTRSK